jgi:hypothetical protein
MSGCEWGRRGVHIGFWWKSHKERGLYENLHIGGMIILKWKADRMECDWIHLAHDKEQC